MHISVKIIYFISTHITQIKNFTEKSVRSSQLTQYTKFKVLSYFSMPILQIWFKTDNKYILWKSVTKKNYNNITRLMK